MIFSTWGEKDVGARLATRFLTKDRVNEMKSKGLTREITEEWMSFYENEFLRTANATAKERAELMRTILWLW